MKRLESVLKVGDCVRYASGDGNEDSYFVGRILEIHESKRERTQMTDCTTQWYYLSNEIPEEDISQIKKRYKNEVFLSEQTNTNPIGSIHSLCQVIPGPIYRKMLEMGQEPKLPTYICNYRYNPESSPSFSPIKYDTSEFELPITPKKKGYQRNLMQTSPDRSKKLGRSSRKVASNSASSTRYIPHEIEIPDEGIDEDENSMDNDKKATVKHPSIKPSPVNQQKKFKIHDVDEDYNHPERGEEDDDDDDDSEDEKVSKRRNSRAMKKSMSKSTGLVKPGVYCKVDDDDENDRKKRVTHTQAKRKPGRPRRNSTPLKRKFGDDDEYKAPQTSSQRKAGRSSRRSIPRISYKDDEYISPIRSNPTRQSSETRNTPSRISVIPKKSLNYKDLSSDENEVEFIKRVDASNQSEKSSSTSNGSNDSEGSEEERVITREELYQSLDVGDNILMATDDPKVSYIAKIKAISSCPLEKRCDTTEFYAQWYYRKQDVPRWQLEEHDVTYYSREIFYSLSYNINPLGSVISKCHVLNERDFKNYNKQDYLPVFLCRFVYYPERKVKHFQSIQKAKEIMVSLPSKFRTTRKKSTDETAKELNSFQKKFNEEVSSKVIVLNKPKEVEKETTKESIKVDSSDDSQSVVLPSKNNIKTISDSSSSSSPTEGDIFYKNQSFVEDQFLKSIDSIQIKLGSIVRTTNKHFRYKETLCMIIKDERENLGLQFFDGVKWMNRNRKDIQTLFSEDCALNILRKDKWNMKDAIKKCTDLIEKQQMQERAKLITSILEYSNKKEAVIDNDMKEEDSQKDQENDHEEEEKEKEQKSNQEDKELRSNESQDTKNDESTEESNSKPTNSTFGESSNAENTSTVNLTTANSIETRNNNSSISKSLSINTKEMKATQESMTNTNIKSIISEENTKSDFDENQDANKIQDATNMEIDATDKSKTPALAILNDPVVAKLMVAETPLSKGTSGKFTIV